MLTQRDSHDLITSALFVTGDTTQLMDRIGGIDVIVSATDITVATTPGGLSFQFIDLSLSDISNVSIQHSTDSQNAGQLVLDLKGPLFVNTDMQSPKQLCIGFEHDLDVVEIVKEITDKITAMNRSSKRRETGNAEMTIGFEITSRKAMTHGSNVSKPSKTSQSSTIALPTPVRNDQASGKLPSSLLKSAGTVRGQMMDEAGALGHISEGSLSTIKSKKTSRKAGIEVKSKNMSAGKATSASSRKAKASGQSDNFDLSYSKQSTTKTNRRTISSAKGVSKSSDAGSVRAGRLKKIVPTPMPKPDISTTQPRRSTRPSTARRAAKEDSDALSDGLEDEQASDDEFTIRTSSKISASVEAPSRAVKNPQAKFGKQGGAKTEAAPASKSNKVTTRGNQNKDEVHFAPESSGPRNDGRPLPPLAAVDSPSHRKPIVIGYGKQGPMNQGISPVKRSDVTKRRNEEAASELSLSHAKRVRLSPAQKARNLQIGGHDLLSHELPAYLETYDEEERVAKEPQNEIEFNIEEDNDLNDLTFDDAQFGAHDSTPAGMVNPARMDEHEPSGSQLSRRVDANGSPYGKNTKLQVTARPLRHTSSRGTPNTDEEREHVHQEARSIAEEEQMSSPKPQQHPVEQMKPANDLNNPPISSVHVLARDREPTTMKNMELSPVILEVTEVVMAPERVPRGGSLTIEIQPLDKSARVPMARMSGPVGDIVSHKPAPRGQTEQNTSTFMQSFPVHKHLPRSITVQVDEAVDASGDWDETEETIVDIDVPQQRPQGDQRDQRGVQRHETHRRVNRRVYLDSSSTPESGRRVEIARDALDHEETHGRQEKAAEEAAQWEKALAPHDEGIAAVLNRITKVKSRFVSRRLRLILNSICCAT